MSHRSKSKSHDDPVVVIVDDEEDVRDLVAEILAKAGLNALRAESAREALELIAARWGDVDLVLTDVMMPELDGPTLGRRIAHEWPDIPVLFMTGYPADTLADRHLLPADTPRIEKPFRILSLMRKVREALRPPPSP